MQSQLVLPIEAAEESPSPWPRLLPAVAILTVIYGLIIASQAGYFTYLVFNSPAYLMPGRNTSPYYRIQEWRVALGVCRGIIGLLMIVAALRLRLFGRSHRLIILGAQLLLALWVLGTAVNSYLFRQRISIYSGHDLLQGIITAVFPLMILLILKEYSKSLAQPSEPSQVADLQQEPT